MDVFNNPCMKSGCSNWVEKPGTYCPSCKAKRVRETHKCVEENCNATVFRQGCRCNSCAATLRNKQRENPTPDEETIDYATYIPTPEQIREECLAIQREWDRHELNSRTVYKQGSVDYGRVYKKP
jgi:hypothetical protein